MTLAVAAPAAPIPDSLPLEQPPELTSGEGAGGLASSLMPLLGSLGSVVFVAMSQPGVKGMVGGGMFLLASLGFVAANGWRQRGQQRGARLAARRRYLAHVADVRARARAAALAQRGWAWWHAPAPQSLAALAHEGSRVGERTPDDPQFLQVRIGTGAQPLAVAVRPDPRPPAAQLDLVACDAADRLAAAYSVADALPRTLDLRSTPIVDVHGPPAAARAAARALVAHAAVFHAAEHLRVAALADEPCEWEWVKWLPHAASGAESDAAGPARLVRPRLDELAALLPPEALVPGAAPGGPHLLLVLDAGHSPSPLPAAAGVTVVRVRPAEPSTAGAVRLVLGAAVDGGATLSAADLAEEAIAPDLLSPAEAEAVARRLAARGRLGTRPAGSVPPPASFTELLAVPDIHRIDLDVAWAPRERADRLRVPIGLTPDGEPVLLDLKESAHGGMGPHGLVVGATGSGKSEVLRTLVLALALTHPPTDLNFVLVDFKGGATFAGMAHLPHVSAVVTNLGAELALADRMHEALRGEMVRRQQALREAGNLSSVDEYERARRSRPELPPLPALLIVVDEFSELLAATPDLADLFAAIGRLGRSLHLHLLLSSQRLDEGRLRGLESHLSYRIGLRTFSAADSRAVLGVPDAHTLPAVPGAGLLRPDPTTLVEFRASYVSGPPPLAAVAAPAHGAAPLVAPFSATPVPPTPVRVGGGDAVAGAGAPTSNSEHATGPSVFELAVEQLRGHGPAAHPVWLPPLATPPTLDELLPDLALDAGAGLLAPSWRSPGALAFPWGLVDRPLEQRREPLVVDLAGAAGHVCVVGGPRTGKSTALRAAVAGLALTRTPQEVQFYLLDLGGGLSGLAGLPHVVGIAARTEADVARRIVDEVDDLVDEREAVFRARRIDGMDSYRVRRDAAAPSGRGDPLADVVVVVDGWGAVRTELEDLEARLQAIAARGLTYGVHLMASASRWSEFRAQLKDLFGTRVELRLGEPADSELDRRAASAVPRGRPGRALTATGHHAMLALPRIDGDDEPARAAEGLDRLVHAVSDAWPGPLPPRLRLLPREAPLAQVLAAHAAGAQPAGDSGPQARVVLGLDERRLAPVVHDDAHLYAFGDSGSGKSSLLRLVAAETMRIGGPHDAQVFTVDYRRALLGVIPDDYLAAAWSNPEHASAGLSDLARYLRARLPGPDTTPDELRTRSWWTGAEVVVLVDDYELVATTTGNPLAPLVPLLAQAADIGLRLVVARRTGGAARAIYDPVLQTLRDLGSPGLLLSGSPDEGALIGGVRPAVLPPGRAQLVTREHGRRLVQLALAGPVDAGG